MKMIRKSASRRNQTISELDTNVSLGRFESPSFGSGCGVRPVSSSASAMIKSTIKKYMQFNKTIWTAFVKESKFCSYIYVCATTKESVKMQNNGSTDSY